MIHRLGFFTSAFLLLSLVLTIIFSTSKFWETRPVIAWDVTLYYSYLPALFIYEDIALENPPQEFHNRQFGAEKSPIGKKVIKMTSGMAIVYSPFFYGAHLYSLNNATYEANGFSSPYRFALLLSDLVFCLLGLWFFGKWLRFFFSEKVSALTMIALYAGTNIPYYSFVEPMSHVYSFTLVSMILYWFQLYLDRQMLKYAIGIGLASGLLVLIRPTNIIALIFPLFLLFSNLNKLESATLIRDFILVSALP